MIEGPAGAPLRPEPRHSARDHARLVEAWGRIVALDDAARGAALDALAREDPALADEIRGLLRFDPGPAADDRTPSRRALFDLVQTDGPDDADDGGALPERIGPVRIDRRIGRGGFGVVFAGVLDHPPRPVAVKILSDAFASPALVRRLEREARLLARLQHPGIAQVLSTGVHDDGARRHPYVVMELVDGDRIDVYARSRSLDLAARIRLVTQLCEAVEHAHRRGVLHRDIKPSNVLVEDGVSGPRVRVLDFGVARLIDADSAATVERTVGGASGTPAYMSPEQLVDGTDAADTRADVYAIGVVLYELVAGRRPIAPAGGSVVEQLRAVLNDEPPPLGTLVPAARGDLETVVHAAIAREPDRRHGSAMALADDLRRVLAHEPVAARPPTRTYLARKFVRRHRVAVAVVAGLVLALVAGIAGTSYGLVGVRRERDENARQLRESLALLVKVAAMIESRPGTLEARDEMLRDLVERIEPLAQHAEYGDPLLSDYADALCQLGSIDLERGRAEEARSRFGAARRIRATDAAAAPDDPERAARHSFTIVRLGDALLALGQRRDAQRLYREAFAIDRSLMAAHPGVRRHADDVAWGCERLAYLAYTLDLDPVEHARLQRWRLEIVDKLLAANSDDRHALLGRAAALSSLADADQASPDRPAQLAEIVEAFRAARRADPSDRRTAIGHATNLCQLAEAAVDLPIAKRRACLDEAEGVVVALATLDPDQVARVALLGVLRWSEACVAADAGDDAAALESIAAGLVAIASPESVPRTWLLECKMITLRAIIRERNGDPAALDEFNAAVQDVLRHVPSGKASTVQDVIEQITSVATVPDSERADAFARLLTHLTYR